MDQVLVLNASFEPMLVIHWQKAMQLLFSGKVEVLEEYEREIRTISSNYRLPAVLRLIKFIPFHKRTQAVRFSRKNVFIRDQMICQYCGRKRMISELTLDHVIPAVQGGQKTWENIVTACIPCNQKKGGRTPAEARMDLLSRPLKPQWLPAITTLSSKKASLERWPERWKVYFSWQVLNTSILR